MANPYSMRTATLQVLLCCLLGLILIACVDPEELVIHGTVDIIVVDGTVTSLAEPQFIRLNYARADRLTGRFGNQPITKASVDVWEDSARVITCHETTDGVYQLPSDFKGQVGHAYQLRFTLTDGTRYVSTQQVMPPEAPITKIRAQFSLKSLSPPVRGYYTLGHDIFIELQDPIEQRNYYRWDLVDYEPQYWCRSCEQGFYSIYNVIEEYHGVYHSGPDLYEACYYPSYVYVGDFVYGRVFDYRCRTQCWEILSSYAMTLFDDQYSNGGLIPNFKVASVPFYQHGPCLAQVRQSSLTPDAYRYYKLFQAQTQNTGGLADTPPSAPVGNVHNVSTPNQVVVGYFTATGVYVKPIYIDRQDYQGVPLGLDLINGYSKFIGGELFYALNGREVTPEPGINVNSPTFFTDNTTRPPTALCAPLNQRTPFKPEGWPD